MSGPDHDAIRAALEATDRTFIADDGYPAIDAGPDPYVPTVAALMEDYAADLRARVAEMEAGMEFTASAFRESEARAEAARADRDAYAAEKVRAALLDAAKAIEACCSDDPGYKVGCRAAAAYLRNLAGAS